MNGIITMTKPGGFQSKAKYENGVIIEVIDDQS